VAEFYFDDETWTLRYLVVETGSWLSGRKVLLSRVALGEPDWESRTFAANLTMEQVRKSPDIDTRNRFRGSTRWTCRGTTPAGVLGRRVRRRRPMYGTAPSGPQMYATTDADDEASAPKATTIRTCAAPEVSRGYHIHANDGDIGHVEDYIIDDGSWLVRFMVVATGSWLSGRSVLISPHWIKSVDGGSPK